MPSYISTNIDELLDSASPFIQELLESEEIGKTVAILGKAYALPINSYVDFANVISYILLGALKPQDVVRALQDMLKVDSDTAYKLAADLDKTVLEKARISILGKSPKDMVTLTFQEGRSPDELRKEILDTTKRDINPLKEPVSASSVLPTVVTVPQPQTNVQATASAAPTSPAASNAPAPKKSNITPGSRSQLMEQLQVLDNIPNDEEIGERLKKIQEQIAGMDKKDENLLESNVALEEFMPKEGDLTVIPAKESPATYSQAPTKYNVDPYREIPEEIAG
jgi:hypothetical protein